MELKYVGAKPAVSARGVTFDQTKPDRYTFLNAAVELLEALSFEPTEDKKVYLYDTSEKERSGKELVELLKKHCANPQEAFDSLQEKTNALIEKYTNQVKENERLSTDERRAWLGNIEIMRDYYLQYVTNESAYQCALNALTDKIHKSHIEEVAFPIGRNHGLVMSHLVDVLRDHKPPYDASMSMIVKDGETVGRLDMNRSKPLNL
ncbi:MAG: hypothetical protein J7J02_00110 [Sulfurovum sp.]|nr:hypothetical protein [Sulfurovum sp.]